MLALTLPLGLSKDEQASSQVVASAVRVLGVYATFPSLREVSTYVGACISCLVHFS